MCHLLAWQSLGDRYDHRCGLSVASKNKGASVARVVQDLQCSVVSQRAPHQLSLAQGRLVDDAGRAASGRGTP